MKLSNTLLALVFLSSLYTANAQKLQEKGFGLINLERHQVTINLLGPGLKYEIGLVKNVTAATSFAPGLASYQEGYTFGFAWHTQIRYYHNFKRRMDINKNILNNSANYFAPDRSVFWSPLQVANNLKAPDGFALAFYGGMYGIQRTNKKGFSFNAEVGFGYYRGDGLPNGYGPLLNFTFGWVATKKLKRNPTFTIKN